MRSKLLHKLSRRKEGWKPEMLIDDTGKPFLNRCMVGNGRISKLVEVTTDDEDMVDHLLEAEVIKTIKNLEEKDEIFIKKQTLIFSVIAQASTSQAQQFVGLIHRDGKMELNRYINQSENLIKRLQKEYIETYGKNMEIIIDNLEDATHRVFQNFSYAIEKGKVQEFINHIIEFTNAEIDKDKK